ncbi:MAG TPA: hypothetical protein VNJ02_02180 [Vicinamibacterales bacterium]|nr:hypothetical protein [Vicinamibacterales bacterium]
MAVVLLDVTVVADQCRGTWRLAAAERVIDHFAESAVLAGVAAPAMLRLAPSHASRMEWVTGLAPAAATGVWATTGGAAVTATNANANVAIFMITP